MSPGMKNGAEPMNPQVKMLLWREWRERRVQFLLGLAWMLAGTVYVVVYETTHRLRTPVASFWSTGMTYAMFAPICLAMRTALGELTARTRPFSDALPVSPRTRGWIRWLGGAVTLIAPILLAVALLSICLATGWIEQVPARALHGAKHISALERESLGGWSAVGMAWTVTATAVWSACALYALLALINTRLKSETHAGFVGAAVMAVWVFLGYLKATLDHARLWEISDWLGTLLPQAMIINYGYGGETGSYGDLSISGRVVAPLAVNTLVQLALAWRFTRRYERQFIIPVAGDQRVRRRRRAFPLWLPTRGIALVWLTLRQSLVMAVPGLVIALMLTLLTMHEHFLPSPDAVVRFVDTLPHSIWIIGMLWSIIVGAGLFAAEVNPRVGEFWRTRPIPPGALFAIKFVFGLAAVLLVLDGTAVFLSQLTPNWGDYYSMNWPYIACMIPQHAQLFCLAVAATCLLRRPVAGGLTAFVLVVLMQLLSESAAWARRFDPLTVYNNLHGGTDFVAQGYPAMAAGVGTMMLICIAVASASLRRYDPKRAVD
jgi:hypothetical protein